MDVVAHLFAFVAKDTIGCALHGATHQIGEETVKLGAGDLVVYPASSVHRVEPVTHGARTAAFFWIQSMVRDAGARSLLFELDTVIRQLTAQAAGRDCLVRLTACYHNLLRRWAEL